MQLAIYKHSRGRSSFSASANFSEIFSIPASQRCIQPLKVTLWICLGPRALLGIKEIIWREFEPLHFRDQDP